MDNKEVSIVDNSAEALISQAINKGVDVGTMERLLALRREIKADYAKEEYDKAMANFQAECPIIKKDKAGGETKSGHVAYHYAPLDSIVSQTKGLLQKHGFSYAIETKTEQGKVSVTCIAKHIAGHSNPSSIELPLGTKTGIMSDTQQVAAAITFAKRYAFCNAFGILTGDQDNDAQPVLEVKPIHLTDTQEKSKIILSLLGKLGEKNTSKIEAIEAVKRLVQLELVKENFTEIISRLEILVSERQPNNSVPTEQKQVSGERPVSPKQVELIGKLMFQKAVNEAELFADYFIHDLKELSMLQAKEVIERLLAMQNEEHVNNE